MKVTKQEIADVFGLSQDSDPDKLTFSKDVFTFRKGYYWSSRKPLEEIFENNVKQLADAGFLAEDLTFGDHYATFKGGEGIKKNSHYWMKFKVTKQV